MIKFIMVVGGFITLSLAVGADNKPVRKLAQDINVNGMSREAAFKDFIVKSSAVEISKQVTSMNEGYVITAPAHLSPDRLLTNKGARTLHSLLVFLKDDGTYIVQIKKDADVEFVKYEGMLNEGVQSDPKNRTEELLKGKWTFSGPELALQGLGTLSHIIYNGRGAAVFTITNEKKSKLVAELPSPLMLTKQ